MVRAIPTWHSIDASRSPASVTREECRRQLAWLGSSAVRVVGIEELLGLPDEAAAVALTFDDGFVNFETECAPLLERHGFPATRFVVTGRNGRAAEELEQRLGQRPSGLAYPFGDVDERVAQHASRYYQWACTTELGALRAPDGLFLLRRLDAWYLRHPATHASWGSLRSRAWIWWRRQGRQVPVTLSRPEDRAP